MVKTKHYLSLIAHWSINIRLPKRNCWLAATVTYLPGRAHLPVDEMLMVDRITEINETGGEKGKGKILAELDINQTCGSSNATSR